MPARNLAEHQAPSCKEVPSDFFLGQRRLSLEHALPLVETIRRRAYSSAQHRHHLHTFVQTQLERLGHHLPQPSCTTSAPLDGQCFQTNSVRKQLPARTGLPCHLAPQPVASTSRTRKGWRPST